MPQISLLTVTSCMPCRHLSTVMRYLRVLTRNAGSLRWEGCVSCDTKGLGGKESRAICLKYPQVAPRGFPLNLSLYLFSSMAATCNMSSSTDNKHHRNNNPQGSGACQATLVSAEQPFLNLPFRSSTSNDNVHTRLQRTLVTGQMHFKQCRTSYAVVIMKLERVTFNHTASGLILNYWLSSQTAHLTAGCMLSRDPALAKRPGWRQNTALRLLGTSKTRFG